MRYGRSPSLMGVLLSALFGGFSGRGVSVADDSDPLFRLSQFRPKPLAPPYRRTPLLAKVLHYVPRANITSRPKRAGYDPRRSWAALVGTADTPCDVREILLDAARDLTLRPETLAKIRRKAAARQRQLIQQVPF